MPQSAEEKFTGEDKIARWILLKRLVEIDAELRQIVAMLHRYGVSNAVDVLDEIAAAYGHQTFLGDLLGELAEEKFASDPPSRRRPRKVGHTKKRVRASTSDEPVTAPAVSSVSQAEQGTSTPGATASL